VSLSSETDYRNANVWREFDIEAGEVLSSLTVSSGTLVPSFNPHITDYMVNVPNSVTDINVTATNYPGASVSISDGTLNVGSNTVTVIVTAEDGISKSTYTIMVNRASPTASVDATLSAGTLTPAFDADTTDYTVSVANNVTVIDVSGIANHSAAAISGNVSGKTLYVGDNNVVTITVVAEDYATTRTYTVRVIREDDLQLFINTVLHPDSEPIVFERPSDYPWIADGDYVKSSNKGIH
jgi:uncharacterized protein YxjI